MSVLKLQRKHTKPETAEAIQWSGENAGEIDLLLPGRFRVILGGDDVTAIVRTEPALDEWECVQTGQWLLVEGQTVGVCDSGYIDMFYDIAGPAA